VEVGEKFGEVVRKLGGFGHLRRKVCREIESGIEELAPQGGDIDEP
jgi:hypothetical protein